MKDRRVVVLRTALEALLESLDATLRTSSWPGSEVVPEPLKLASAALLDRLGTANRLAHGKFTGPSIVVAALDAICSGIRRLDASFVEYRKSMTGNAEQKEAGASSLRLEIESVRSESSRWS